MKRKLTLLTQPQKFKDALQGPVHVPLVVLGPQEEKAVTWYHPQPILEQHIIQTVLDLELCEGANQNTPRLKMNCF